MVFHESGFLLTVPDLTSCQAPAAASIQAVRTDLATQACVAHDGFARQSKEVFFWSEYLQPATGTRPLRVDGSAVAAASPGTPVTLTFNANARSSFNVAYDDAGQLRLQALYLGSGEEAGLVMTGSDSLVAAPHHLRVRATTDSDGTIPLDNATPNGEPHWPAGEDFQVEVAGVCADGTVTPNFAAATTLTAIAADPALVVPDPFSGGPFTAGDYSEGLVTGAASYREVGTVTLQAVAADYLESGIDVIGASDPVGRFTPHHFAVALNEPRFASGCGGGYTYLGQSFDFAVAPVITVTAQNRQNGTTGNYTGDWWKISRDSLNGRLYSAAEGTLDPSGLPEEDPTISDLGGGIGLLTFAAGDGLLFERSAPTAPFEAEISLEINVVDEDDIACADNPVRFGEATAGNGIAFDAAKTMRWGRLALSNAYGSELVPLAMPLRAEYFDGGSFVTNDADICTSLALSQLTLSNTSGTVSADQPMAVGAGSTVASLLDPLVNGDAGLTFSAPGAEGYVDVAAGLALLPWLRYDWDGDGSHDDDPAARATFGIYRSRPSLIYRRETWR
jgi:MSHA biogenesis protein MshQ